jgi:hypothetical protein
MASIELPEELQSKINTLVLKARDSIQKKHYSEFIKFQYEKWDLLPEPKSQWEESYRIAKTMITFFIKYNINFSEAKKWLMTLKKLDDIQKQHPGEFFLMKGKIEYEEKNMMKLLNLFLLLLQNQKVIVLDKKIKFIKSFI